MRPSVVAPPVFAFVFAVALALSAAPFALAQGHEHEEGAGVAFVLHDGPDGGRAVLGDLTHFGFVLLNNSMPQVHRNAQFEVVQDGVTVFATKDTHEYDGVFSLDYTFTRPGAYSVMAMSEGMRMGQFNGTAVAPVNETVARIDAKAEPQADARLSKITISIVDEGGKIIPHTDAIVEIRDTRAQALVARLHLHIHESPIVFTQALPPFDTTMHVTAYKAFATGRGSDVRAVVADVPLKGAAPAAPNAPVLPHQPNALKPLGAKATGDGFTLWASYDPEPQIPVGSTVRLVGTVLNASGTPQPHVDFDLLVNGPSGLLFSSKSLHEYDGVLEYEIQPFVPGFYEGTITAHPDDSKQLTVPLQFEVVPPASPLSMGPGLAAITVKGLDKAKAGEPTDLTFSVRAPEGPVQHSEVDITIFHKGEAPVYQFKLHTHESGDTKATVVFPHEGDWTVRVDALPTDPDPVVFYGPAGPGAPITFAAKVAPGAALTDVLSPAGASAPARTVPALGWLALCAGLAAVAVMRRR